MEFLLPLIEAVKLGINIISILILCVGVLICVKDLILIATKKVPRPEKMRRVHNLKTNLGGFVLLGLEVLIIADIIETIIRPTLNDILMLAAIVTIRTVISFFLNREIGEIKKTSHKKTSDEADVQDG